MTTQYIENQESFTPIKTFQYDESSSAFTPVLKKPVAQRISPFQMQENIPISKAVLLNMIQIQNETLKKQRSQILSLIQPMKLDFDQENQSPILQTPIKYRSYQEKSDNLIDEEIEEGSQTKTQKQEFMIPHKISYEGCVSRTSFSSESKLVKAFQQYISPSCSTSPDSERSFVKSITPHSKNSSDTLLQTKRNVQNQSGRISSSSFEQYFLSSEENLNSCVDGLFTKDRQEPLQKIKSIIRYSAALEREENDFDNSLDEDADSNQNTNGDQMKAKGKRRRQRKNLYQHNILIEEFDQNPNWDKEQIKRLSDILGLKESQIYKWNWDHRKKTLL
ncbi:UNKNOWN [Stylonychia lemnae]|uniref:Homeobox domain-containing protein n=1 Tax=Stylonychia lemnae TaxID=5949 RepID=A0A077ZTJ9_STYLE|nr:UNKNOWN [Stylonychia lemnae]|eukprot:CDW72834.1 UNKNOWN [Stylonychia lemnae]